jgi:sulfide:quinone oxidoreductase
MSARPTVVVIGAGPAGLGALHRLRDEPGVHVIALVPDGLADYLPGALAVATGDAGSDRFRAPVRLDGIEVIPLAAERIEAGQVRVGDRRLEAQAVIAAPGLALVPFDGGPRWPAVPPSPRAVAFWDLPGATRVAPVLEAFTRGVLSVVIASPLYRCPPAPYGLAIRLARRAKRLGLAVQVRLTTPEPRPLAAIGSEVSRFLVAACTDAGVEVEFDVHPDPTALAAGEVTDSTGAPLPTDLAVVIPPHHAHPLLAELATPQQLVAVDAGGRTAQSGLYVAGDAVASPYPRAMAPATVSGRAAAEGVLADLGFATAVGTAPPEPDCFIDQGAGRYSRLQISYPAGPPPAGAAAVTIHPPALAAAGGFDAALERWRESCSDRSDD